ncbi:MAG: glycosyltransferase family 4 protein, partial [Elusimicrobia bacterium]|nr:glycosyltransferase family 4 protein [Elusimicrobiota bacterium]
FDVVLISGAGGILDQETAKLANVKVIFIKNLLRQINPFNDFFALMSLISILKKEKPDIVHTHSSKAGILGRFAAKIAGVPKIVHTFHGFGFNDFQTPLIRNIYIFSEKLTSLVSNKLIFVSEQNMSTAGFYKIGKKTDYLLVRSGIKLSNYRNIKINTLAKKRELGLQENSKIITTIGPFKPQKNLIDFIKVAKIVCGKLSDVIFLIIGDGQQRNILEEEIRKLKLTGKVLLLGWRNDINEILAITDIFSMTSLWEGLPRSAVEALVSGKPVIAYSIDGNNDIIKNGYNGFLTKPKDIDALSENIIKLLKDEKLLNNLSQNAKNSIDGTFDIDYMVKQQENLYTNLIKER